MRLKTEGEKFRDRALAKLYGFPACCVDFYTDPTKDLRLAGMLAGGFRPCPACKRKPEEELIRTILKQRILPTPYPVDAAPAQYQAALDDPRFTAEERECLARELVDGFMAPNRELAPDELVDVFLVDMQAPRSEYLRKVRADAKGAQAYRSEYEDWRQAQAEKVVEESLRWYRPKLEQRQGRRVDFNAETRAVLQTYLLGLVRDVERRYDQFVEAVKRTPGNERFLISLYEVWKVMPVQVAVNAMMRLAAEQAVKLS